MLNKISETRNNVIKILKRIDVFLYEFGEKIL